MTLGFIDSSQRLCKNKRPSSNADSVAKVSPRELTASEYWNAERLTDTNLIG